MDVQTAVEQTTVDDDTLAIGARIGYAGKAVLYVALAVLIGRMTVRGSSGDTSATGAIDALARQPLGTALLLLLAVGLVAHGGHAAWSAFHQGEETWRRLSSAARALVYLGLGSLAVMKALGSAGSGTSSSTGSSLTGTVLGWPGGTWLVAAVGLAVVTVGVVLFYRAVTATWREEFDRHRISPEEHTFIRRTGQIGHLARALAYGMVGGFIVFAAVTHDPDKGGGLDAALGEVTQSSFAPFVLAPLAVGMLAYALFAAMMARYVEV